MKRDVQFVRAIDGSYPVVRDRFRQHPETILSGVEGEGGRAIAALTARLGGRETSRDVIVEVIAFDEPAGAAPGTHILLRGDASRHPDLFPHLEARIDLVPATENRTAVFFIGTYKPPFGVVGGAIDALALHRFAEAALQGWFEEIVDRLEADPT